MRVEKAKVSVAERREADNMKAAVAKNAAHTDYIAMMANVEIPEPEVEDGEVLRDEG